MQALHPDPGRPQIPKDRARAHHARVLRRKTEEETENLAECLSAIRAESLQITVDRKGHFYHGRPAVLYLGLKGNTALTNLHQRICNASGLHDDRHYTPHLTLARAQSALPQTALRNWLEDALMPFTLATQGFTLYRSELTSQGPRYTAIKRYA
ncbi:MAG: RNA 2',3'-cyclic phosphodiesterase [Nitrosarchaeum sp.]|nr:RNA 2',3'-cyclic phosphodiesterase [Nitrosarchaeum sp.]